MDIKQRLQAVVDLSPTSVMKGHPIQALCREALAEIERLESTALERAWQEFVRRIGPTAIAPDGRPYLVICHSRDAFQAGFAAASRRGGEDS